MNDPSIFCRTREALSAEPPTHPPTHPPTWGRGRSGEEKKTLPIENEKPEHTQPPTHPPTYLRTFSFAALGGRGENREDEKGGGRGMREEEEEEEEEDRER